MKIEEMDIVKVKKDLPKITDIGTRIFLDKYNTQKTYVVKETSILGNIMVKGYYNYINSNIFELVEKAEKLEIKIDKLVDLINECE